MALYDNRVFRVGDMWWAAEVHGGTGVGVGQGVPRIQDETVFFTCLSDEKRMSRIGSISAGMLNRLSHSSIVAVLQRSKPWSIRMDISPSNAPDPQEFSRDPHHRDSEGLEWAIHRTRAKRLMGSGIVDVPAIDVICLDDSALRKQILLQDDSTYDEARRGLVADVDEELVNAVKSFFEDVRLDEDEG